MDFRNIVEFNESVGILAKEGSGHDEHDKSVSYKMGVPSSSPSQQEKGIKSTLISNPQKAITSWTEQTKPSWLDWEQDTTGWMLICTVCSRLARRITVLVTSPQWLASTWSMTAHSLMLSGKQHGQRTPLWEARSLLTRRLCGGQQLSFEWWASPSSIRRRRGTLLVQNKWASIN